MASNAYTALALNSMLRPMINDATQAAPGVIAGPATPGLVQQTSTASQSIQVLEAAFVVPGASPASNGAVLWTPGASVTKALNTPNATNPRIDLVTIQVTDPGSAITPIQADVVIQTGTPAASPVAPALAAGALLVGTINVPSGTGSNITNAMIVDNRVFTGNRGGLIWTGNKANLSQPQAGDMVYESTTNQLWFMNNTSTWVPLPGVGSLQRNSKLITATQGAIAATAVALTGSAMNFTMVAGRKYRVHAHGTGVQSTVAGDLAQLHIYQDGAEIQRTRCLTGAVANRYDSGWSMTTEITGTAITSNFTLQCLRAAGTGTLTTIAGTTDPIFFEIMDVGGV